MSEKNSIRLSTNFNNCRNIKKEAMINNSKTCGNRFLIVKHKFSRVENDDIMITHYKINTKVVGRGAFLNTLTTNAEHELSFSNE